MQIVFQSVLSLMPPQPEPPASLLHSLTCHPSLEQADCVSFIKENKQTDSLLWAAFVSTEVCVVFFATANWEAFLFVDNTSAVLSLFL